MKILFITLVTLSVYAKDFIVLIPGAASSGDQISIRGMGPVFGRIKEGEYFKHFKQELSSNSFNVLTCPKTRDGDRRGINARARDCQAYLFAHLVLQPSSRFHLIGHSLGGLVGRRLLSFPLISNFIKSLTTISTPHQGAVLADYVVKNYQERSAIASFIRLIQFTPDEREYLRELTTNASREYRNVLRRPIYSISNVKTNKYHLPLTASSRVIRNELMRRSNKSLQNDGVVETSSMVFGEHLAEIEADHLESACVLYTRKSRGCKNILKVLLPHLEKIVE